MKSKLLIFVVLLVGIIACVGWSPDPSRHYYVYAQKGFTDDQITQIFSAATEWQIKSGNYWTFSGVTNNQNPGTLSMIPTTPKDMQTYCSGALGETWYAGQSSNINLINSASGAAFRQIALHEIGHALGANHIGPGNIMCADNGCASQHVECDDLVEVCHHWGFGCESYSMPGCANMDASK